MRVSHLAACLIATMAFVLGAVSSASAAGTQFYANGGGKYDFTFENAGAGEFAFANTAPQAFSFFAEEPNGYLVLRTPTFQIRGVPDCLLAHGGRDRPPAFADVYGTITSITGTVPPNRFPGAQVGSRYALLNILDNGEATPSNPDPDEFLFAVGIGGPGCGNFFGNGVPAIVVHGNVVVQGL